MSKKREASPEPRPPTTPKFHLVKNTFDIFNNRVAVISADPGYATNPNRLKYFLKMMKIRRRVEKLLRSYPQWQPEPPAHDPNEATIPKHLEKTLRRLAMPSRKYVMATFVKVNEMINELKDDHYFFKNPRKARRIRELCGYRKQICCLYSKYSPEPDPTFSCHRFRPCSTKVVPIYAIARSDKNKKRLIKIKSRVLHFEFDDETVELALPNYQKIKTTFEFYENMANQLKNQICDHSEPLNKKKILGNLLCAASKRRDFLDGLKAEIECRKKIEVKADEKNGKFAVEGTFDKKFTNFTPFTHFLELPSKKKLKDALEGQKQLLEKVAKDVKESKSSRARSANTEKYSSKITKHVEFLENILDSYPVEEKPPHCSKPEEKVEAEKKVVSVKTVTGENGKTSRQYTFDSKTNELAQPKISVLAEAKKVHEELLKEFEADARKAANLKKPDQPADEEKSEEATGPKKLPSEGQKNQMKAAKEAEITKRDHAGLKVRGERLAELLKAETDRIKRMQTSKTDGACSYMFHHMACCAEQEVDRFDQYEMQSEHKPVTNSIATRCRIQASLEVYRNFFESREGDVLFKKQCDLVLKSLKESKQQDEAGNDEIGPQTVQPQSNMKNNPENVDDAEPKAAEAKAEANACEPPKQEEKIEKVDKHLLHLYKNMKLLEKMLEENPEKISCVHVMSHKKFETEAFISKQQRPVDKERLEELAKPTETRLRNTLDGFRKLMSKETQERIELMLSTKAVPTKKIRESEKLEESLNQKIGTRSDLEKAAVLLTMIEQKVTADMFEEMAYELHRKLPKLIKNYKEPVMATSYWINLRDIAVSLILSSHEPLRCHKELKVINKLAGVIADFIIKIQLRSLQSTCSSSFPRSKTLHSVQQNEFLINMADKLIGKLAKTQELAE